MIRRCAEKKPQPYLQFWLDYAPLIIAVNISCPLYNIQTVEDLFMKL